MNLESIVTSLELSQKLNEIGVKQESLFGWVQFTDSMRWVVVSSKAYLLMKEYSAFTAQELWDMMPSDNVAQFSKSHIFALESFVGNYLKLPTENFNVKQINYNAEREEKINLANCLALLIIAQHEDKNNA